MNESATTLFQHGTWWAFASVFAGGVLTSLTPCVYPLIPITVSLFGGRGENVGRGRALLLASCYVAGIGAMYSALGVFAGLSGSAFGTHMASPYVMVPIALLFLGMAASMFGAFEMSVPAALQARLTRIGGKGPAGAFAMGLVSGIIAAPCTGPVLASVLAYVATTRSVLLGSTLLFTYALGMGVLFFAIALFAISLPKSGAWMETVKSIFGIAMVVAALYFLRNVSPALAAYGSSHKWFLIAQVGLVVAGVAIGGVHLSFHDHWWLRVRKGVGVVLLVGGMFGGIGWALAVPDEGAAALLWHRGDVETLERARQRHAPALLDFYADWCLPCKELDVKTFHAPAVARALARFELGKIDCTKDDDAVVVATQARYHADTLPSVILIDSDGKVIRKIDRFVEPAELLPMLEAVK